MKKSPRHRSRRALAYKAPAPLPIPLLLGLGGGVLITLGLVFKNTVVSMLRKPDDILKAVAEIDPENNPTLQRGAPPAPKPTDTWCNKFVALVTAKLGAPIPFGKWGTLANDQIEWLDAGNDGWYQLPSAQAAQDAALEGKVAVATWFNLSGGPGHIALVLPVPGPSVRIAQAGATNFNDGSVSNGFGSKLPTFYAHA